jgi:hypothetical protein
VVLELITTAIELAANPFALVGYILLGVYSQTLWQAVKYGFLWGVAIFIFRIALGKALLTDMTVVAVQFGLSLLGAIIITVGVFYLYRWMRGRGAGPGRTNGSQKPPRLRRVK